MTRLRDATPDDLPAIRAVYAPYVLESTATFELEVPSLDEMALRFDKVVSRGLPFLAVLNDAGAVAGYGYAGPYHDRPGYRYTVEDTVYLAAELHGLGLGTVLLQALIDRARALGMREMIGIVGDQANTASRRLHTKLGFREAGILENVGEKFGRRLDTILHQKTL